MLFGLIWFSHTTERMVHLDPRKFHVMTSSFQTWQILGSRDVSSPGDGNDPLPAHPSPAEPRKKVRPAKIRFWVPWAQNLGGKKNIYIYYKYQRTEFSIDLHSNERTRWFRWKNTAKVSRGRFNDGNRSRSIRFSSVETQVTDRRESIMECH